jgi:hypothetical protein
MALHQSVPKPRVVATGAAAARIRRCTFRRLNRVETGNEASFEVSCLYPDRRIPLPLGDLEMSSAICAACTADHIFRPDED